MRRKVNVKRIDLKRLYKELFIKLDKVYEKIKRKKGRPKKYKESLIYFAFAFKVARNLSYRDLEYQLKEINLEKYYKIIMKTIVISIKKI